jgi:hypothetical protein
MNWRDGGVFLDVEEDLATPYLLAGCETEVSPTGRGI